jgi:hypothetical protein
MVVVMSSLLSARRTVVSGLVQLAFDEPAEQLQQALPIGQWQALPPTAR